MIIVADTSPLNYLVVIREIDLLPSLFGQVIIPPAVWAELQPRELPWSCENGQILLHHGLTFARLLS